MGNILRQTNNYPDQSEAKTEVQIETLSEKPLRPPLGKIKGRFKQETEFFILSLSEARKLVQKRIRFQKILLDCYFLHPEKRMEVLKTFLRAFKDRKLTSQALSLKFLIGKDGDLRKFVVDLNLHRNISILSLHFSEGPAMTKQRMKFLVLKLRRMHLSELKISFGLFPIIYPEGLSPLFSGFKHFICLSSLTLDLQYYNPLSLPAIKELISSLKRMRRLERLRISFKDSLIEGKAMEELLSGLGELKHISHLSFEFFDSVNLLDVKPFNNVSTMLTSLKCLTSLELILDFRGRYTENPIITHITSGLKSLTSLKSLTLSLFPQAPGYVEYATEILSEALEEMKSLHKLDLRFSGVEFTKKYQEKLSSGFKDLKMLKHLSLFLNFKKASEKDVENFSLVFENMKALNELHLNFGNSRFNKKMVHNLYENLKRVSSLKHFFLEIHFKELKETEKEKFISKFSDVKVEFTYTTYKGKWHIHFYL